MKKKIFKHKLQKGVNPIPAGKHGISMAILKNPDNVMTVVNVNLLQLKVDKINKDKYTVNQELLSIINSTSGKRGNGKLFKFFKNINNVLYLPIYYKKDFVLKSKRGNRIADREKGTLSHYLKVPIKKVELN